MQMNKAIHLMVSLTGKSIDHGPNSVSLILDGAHVDRPARQSNKAVVAARKARLGLPDRFNRCRNRPSATSHAKYAPYLGLLAAIYHRRVVRAGAAHITSHLAFLVVMHAAVPNHWASVKRHFKAKRSTMSSACLLIMSHLNAFIHLH